MGPKGSIPFAKLSGESVDQQIDDNVLLQAIRQRMLDEIKAKREAAAIINNNLYGQGGGGPSGIQAGMHDAAPSGGGDDRDYFVDILRENIDPENPSLGWKKTVHRHTEPKGKNPKKKVMPE